jgi:beta-carotene 15,15'-dioxygenase
MWLSEPNSGVGRSTIGCVACALLAVAGVIDFTLGRFDLLDWPGLTAGLILVVGLPHGSLDIELLINAKDDPAHFSLAGSLIAYVGTALSIVLLWWLLPSAAMVTLLLLSAYHFGGDWSGLGHGVERLAVGASLLSAPALVHESPVAFIFSWLIPSDMAVAIAGAMHLASVPLLLGVAVLASFRWGNNRAQCEEIIVVAAAAVVLQPLTFFVIYFCALHSMRHLADVRRTLSNSKGSVLIARGAPYVVAAMICCGAGAVFFPDLPTGAAFLSSVFIGLAALTVPHMLLCELPQGASLRAARHSA